MTQRFDIEDYDWKVKVWYLDGEVKDRTKDILFDLEQIGCKGKELLEAKKLLTSYDYNTGLTYSNYRNHESVIVIGKSCSARECANTMIHERCHLQAQICHCFNIDPMSEEAAYLAGDIGGKMYQAAQILLCDDCRKRYLRKRKI